jgi:hypothetical protein
MVIKIYNKNVKKHQSDTIEKTEVEGRVTYVVQTEPQAFLA